MLPCPYLQKRKYHQLAGPFGPKPHRTRHWHLQIIVKICTEERQLRKVIKNTLTAPTMHIYASMLCAIEISKANRYLWTIDVN
jgi:hypothetical protein